MGENEVYNYPKIVAGLHQTFNSGRTRSMEFRKKQLKALIQLLEENTDKIIKALEEDLNKSYFEAYFSEILYSITETKSYMKKMEKFCNPSTVSLKSLFTLSDTYKVHRDPWGVVLVIGAWNFINLSLVPLSAAIAGGNCVVLKPSEVSVHSSQLLVDLIPKYLDESCYKVILVGVAGTQALLKEKYDYIFYTGSFNTGKIIHEAANRYLTPCTLELGGKSPCYIDDTADIKLTAQRIIWGKLTNFGQVCIGVDYVLCSKEMQGKFFKAVRNTLKSFYGDDLQKSKELGRIVNKRHFNRLRNLLKETSGNIVIGGAMDENDLWIEPTFVDKLSPDDVLMSGEIFGPILPIVTVSDHKEAIEFINKRPKPLTIYVYTKNKKVSKEFINNTRSGSCVINDCVYHFILPLPFGGVGESGMGQYHSLWSLESFTRPKTVMERSFNSIDNLFSITPRYPPHTPFKKAYTKFFASRLNYSYINVRNVFQKLVELLIVTLFGMLLMYGWNSHNDMPDKKT